MRKIISILLLVAVVGTGLWYIFRDQEELTDVTTETPVETVEVEEEPEEDKSFQLSVEALDSDEYGIKADSGFKMITSEEVSIEKLSENIRISPEIDFEVERVSEKEYLLQPNKELLKNKVYVISYDPSDYGKAFQVVDSLKLTEKYPGNQATDVPQRTLIEMHFNSKNVKDLDEHFSIEPEVEGEFTYNADVVTFVPTALEAGKTYEVTIKSGLSDGERTLEEDISYSFTTGYGNDFPDNTFYSLSNVLPDESASISILGYNNHENYSMKIYQVVDFESFKQAYDDYYQQASHPELDFDVVYDEEVPSAKYQYRDYVEVPGLEKGRYIVELKADGMKQYTFLQVNRLQVYYTSTVENELFWTIDHMEKNPVKGVEVYDGDTLLGSTDLSGTLLINSSDSRDYKVVFEEESYLINTNRNNRYEPYYYYDNTNTDYWSFIYKDRSAYLPNDTVHIFGFIRAFNDKPVENVTLSLGRYWREEVFIEKEIDLKTYQTLNETLDLEGLESGYYQLQLRVNGELIESQELIVNQYEKPEVYLETSLDKKVVFTGDSVHLNVLAKYFNELPYEGMKLGINNNGTYVGEVFTDKNGIYEDDLEVTSNQTSWYPRFVNINVEARDIQDTYVNSRKYVEVFSRDIMMLGEVEEVNDSASVTFDVNKIDLSKYDGSFGKHYETVKGETIDVEYTVNIKDNYTEKIFLGTFINPIHKISYDKYEYESRSKMLDKIQSSTIDGKGQFAFDIEDDHYYEITVEAKDTQGRRTTYKMYYGKSDYTYYYTRDDLYSLSGFDDQRFVVGDNVFYEVLASGSKIGASSNDHMLELRLRDGLLGYDVIDKASNSFNFEASYRPNILLKVIYYDGYTFTVLPKWDSQLVPYDYESLEAEIEYEVDKVDFLPGETAEIDFDVNYDGKPFDGMLNVSVVDEAYFAIYEDYFNLGPSLHSFIYSDGIVSEGSTLEFTEDTAFGAEMGEGGDGDYLRDDFKDTAYFKTVEVVDGKASVEFELPDNLTSWRLTLHAVNDDLIYKQLKGNVFVKLPYFVRSLNNSEYVTGDELSMTVTCDGDNVTSETDVSYLGKLIRGENVTETTVDVKGKEYVSLPLGILEAGEYDTVVEGRIEGGVDGILEKITVKDHYIETTHRITSVLSDDYEKKYNRETMFSLYNKAAKEFVERVYEATFRSEYRLEEILGSDYAKEILSQYFDVTRDEISVESFQNYDGGLKQLRTGESSLFTSTLIMGTKIGLERFNEENLEAFLMKRFRSGELLPLQRAEILWALASNEKPVLLLIDKHIEESNMNTREKLYIAMALTELGDKSRAKEFMQEVLDEELVGLDDSASLLCGVYTGKLGLNYDAFTEDYSEGIKSDDTLAIEKLFYINSFPVEFDETTFTYTLNGDEKVVELPDVRAVKISIDEGDEISFSDVGEDIIVDEWVKVYGTDYKQYQTQEVSVYADVDDDISLGDRVKVTYHYKKPMKESAIIHSRIPAGFEYVGGDGYADNQNLTLYTPYDRSSGELVVYFSANQAGKYQFESTIIQNAYKGLIYLSDPEVLEVTHD